MHDNNSIRPRGNGVSYRKVLVLHRRSGRVSLMIAYDELKMHMNLKATSKKKLQLIK